MSETLLENPVEVVLDFNGFFLQAGPLFETWTVPAMGQEIFFDDKIWRVERVVRSLDITWLSKSNQLGSMLGLMYGAIRAEKLLAEMTQFDQPVVGASSTILAPPKLRKEGGKICRFIYIKLSREHD